MRLLIDIYSKNPYPSGSLSNFAAHSFQLDGVQINSMKGFLKSLKVSPEQQTKICLLDAKTAKEIGSAVCWQNNGGIFHWNGSYFSRFHSEYWQLLVRAYDALADQNRDFAQALLDSGHSILWHSIGKLRKRETCLTTWEFIRLLYRERRRVRHRR